jgi:hypothetical protein
MSENTKTAGAVSAHSTQVFDTASESEAEKDIKTAAVASAHSTQVFETASEDAAAPDGGGNGML